ncbi:MAG TPA: efflux RND transporter periplasmic adaptor subunit [Chryseolinea sp.]|nr:efflux RND transporter periplasmic adaptor subunit [Chryseolinea sp.]HPM28889.1 efflux RND transporter periplasmic adaptor subunit [Chryseolinea sp.]
MNKKVITIIAVVGVIFLLALPKLNLFNDDKAGAVTATPQAAGKLPVEAMIVKEEALDNKLVVTGSVLANESLELKSEVSGKITNLYFKEGKHVRKGELLLQINDEEIRAQLQKEKFNQKLNQDIESRQSKLLAKDAISQEEYDNALNRLNTNTADLKLLEAQLDKTQVIAPFDGVIGLRYISDGAYITPSTTIATLYNISPAKIEFAVPSRYSAQVRPGQKILFTIESDTKNFTGEVYAIEPRIDPTTRTLKIRALAENSKGLLLPGQFVKVELILSSVSNALLVPTEAVIPDLNNHKVFVLEGGKAKEVKVETGMRTETKLEIISGLNPGDSLITTGILQLRAGMAVQVLKINTESKQ